MNAILQKHFEKHGFNSDFFDKYELFTSEQLKNIDFLSDYLYKIRQTGKKIVIYTDYDVDGMMSSVVAYAGLSELGFNVELFYSAPSNGYGFRVNDVDAIYNLYSDVDVILTGDVGIGCNDAVTYARSKGVEVIVTDHHPGKAPVDAVVTVNPNQKGETYSHNGICGCYVLYKVLETFVLAYDPSKLALIQSLQLFVGISTISDSMPLLFENRSVVRESIRLARILYDTPTVISRANSAVYSRAFVGMKELLSHFASQRKIKKAVDIDETFYGFYLVPFLNSCKRMDGDMSVAYGIFFSECIKAAASFPNMRCVKNSILYLEALNTERKRLKKYYVSEIVKEKAEQETVESFYMQCGVYITDAPAGLLGLLGSQFLDETGIPTLVVNRLPDGSFSGSGRSPSWFDFANQAFEYGLNVQCAGHEGAFGVFIPNETVLNQYVDFYNNVVVKTYNDLPKDKIIDTSIVVSYDSRYVCDFMYNDNLVRDYLNEIENFRPFGRAFPEPRFKLIIDLNNVSERLMGDKNQHVKLITSDGLNVLLFNRALEYMHLKNSGNNVLVCSGAFKVNEFRNTVSVDFTVRDII